MHIYSMTQWLFIFYTYCFLGWCFESANVSIRSRQFINRGFIRGPFLPLYGSGATMMYIVSLPFQDNVMLTYIAGCIGATALEFVVGVIMDTLFDVRYWDYSKRKFNYKGHICLRSTIVWGFLTIFMTKVIHQPIEAFMLSIPPNILGYITFILTVYIAGDFALSFKAALDLRDVLAKMQRVKEELERMQKRLDVIIALNNEELRDEIAELRARYNLYMENRKNYKEMLDFYERDMIINNPDMVSSKFKVTFEELKNVVREKISR